MIYIEAIETIDEKELFNLHKDKIWIFLGGSITRAWNWQQDFTSKLEALEFAINKKFVVFNPRRKDFDTSDKSQTKKQIVWEYQALKLANYILFWFSHETLAPITLFKYGKFINSNKRLFVGCDPKYKRLEDVVIQTSLEKPYQKISYSLDCMIEEIRISLGEE